jgi:putative flippase GtrA
MNLEDRLARVVSGVRFGKFASVGVVGAIFDNTTLLVLTVSGVAAAAAAGLGIPGYGPELAKFAGIEVAIFVMFLLNEHWTFAEHGAPGSRPFLRRLATSNVVRIGGITVQLVVFSLVYRFLHVDLSVFGVDAWLLVASACGIGAGMTVNFVAESLVTWRVHESR